MKKILFINIVIVSSLCFCNQYDQVKELIKTSNLDGTKDILVNCYLKKEEKVALLIFAQDICNQRKQAVKWWQWRQTGLTCQNIYGHVSFPFGFLITLVSNTVDTF